MIKQPCLILRRGLLAVVAGLSFGGVVGAQQADLAQWDDAYFRMPFQNAGQWLATNMYLRMTLRNVDRGIGELRAERSSLPAQDAAFITLIDAIEANDVSAASEVIYGYGAPLSADDYRVGVARFNASWSSLGSPRLRYVVPMADGGLYVVSAVDLRTNTPTIQTYRISRRDDGSYGYAVGRSYEEYEAIPVRVFMGAAQRPDLYSELSIDDVIAAGVNYGLSFVPDEEQQKIGIASPFELLLNATAVEVPFLGELELGIEIPEAISFYREAFAAVAEDPAQDSLRNYFDDKTVQQTREGAALLTANDGPSMAELLAKRRIKLFVDADPLWAVMHIQFNDDPSVIVQDVYRTDFVVRRDAGGFRIVGLFALPVLKSLFETEFVQRHALERISSGQEVSMGSAVRKIIAPEASASWGVYVLAAIGLVVVVGMLMLFRGRT